MSPTSAAAGVLVAAAGAASAGRLRRGWRRVLRRPASVVGGVIVLLFVVLAIGAPWIARTDPVGTDWSQIRTAPSWTHPFGTDDLGRDNFARVVWGSRISMQAGVFSILLAIAVGVPLGLVAGYYRGALDQVLMRLTDAWLAFPFLILAIGLVTIMGPSLTNATIAIGLGATPTYIRLTRGLVLSTAAEDYVLGARALGAGDLRLMARHIL
ncbi:MAG: diguanylate cyclase, partial [Candidatus Rokuibacteriota bacterium]